MVSNEEISRRLALKRRGVNPDEEFKKERGNVCPKCGTANLKNAKFCIGCGSGFNKTITPRVNEVKSNSIVCPGCGSENKPSSKFCIGCGNSLETTIKHEEVPNSVICPECQSKNKLESKFCIKCGSKLNETSNESIEADGSDMEIEEEEIQVDIKDGASHDSKIDTQGIQLDVGGTNPLNKEIDENPEISSENTSEEKIDNNSESDTKASVLDEIKKAKELLDMGAISEEEFEKIKSKCLEQLN